MLKIAGEYSIEIYLDTTFTLHSADNIYQYDAIYVPDCDYQLSTKIGIKLFKENELIKSVFVGGEGGATGIHPTSVICDKSRIILRCGDNVFCLTVPEVALLWRTKADTFTCFQIFEYSDDYIVHGELEISRLDKNGKILWQQSGSDIFVAYNGTPDFKLTASCIIAKDFENRVYHIGYNGSILKA